MTTPSLQANIGKFLEKVFAQKKTTNAINLEELEKATEIGERRGNTVSNTFLTGLNKLDTFDLQGQSKAGGDGYLSRTELGSFFDFVNSNRTTQNKKFLGDVLITEGKQTEALKDKFNLADDEQIKAENYRLLNAILDPATGETKRNLSNVDIKQAEGDDGFLGFEKDDIRDLKTNEEIVISEAEAKARITTKQAKTAAAKEAIIEDDMATTISQTTRTSDTPTTNNDLQTWLKEDTNAITLKDKLGLTNGVAKKIVEGSDDAAKKNLQLALNSLRELASMAIVKDATGGTGKNPTSLEELLILRRTEFISPFYKIRRDAALTILLNLTELDLTKPENKTKVSSDYTKFEGDKSTNLLKADSDSFNSYANGKTGGPGKDWLNNNINSTKVTAEQIGNLAKINTGTDIAERGKAWAAFYKSADDKRDMKTFAAQFLLQLDKVKNGGDNSVTLTGSDNKAKAAELIKMIDKNTVTIKDGKLTFNAASKEYTIPVKTSGIVWDTASNGSGALVALKEIFKQSSSS